MLADLLIVYTCNVLFLYQLVTSLATYALLYTIFLLRIRHKRYKLARYYNIPGPKPNLFEGNYGIVKTRPYAYEIDKALRDQYGKNFLLFYGDLPFLFVTDLEILRKVFIEDIKIFNARLRPVVDTLISESVLFVEHKRWKLYRKILSPLLSSYAIKGEESAQSVRDTVKLVLDYIDNRLESHHDSDKRVANIVVHDLMKSVVARMVSNISNKLPDVPISENDSHAQSLDKFFANAESASLDWVLRLPLIKIIANVMAKTIEAQKLGTIKTHLDKAIDDSVTKAPSNMKSADQHSQVIDTLIRLHCAGKITREAVVGNCFAILFAGYDTTSTTLAYLFWVLAKHTDVQDRLRSELIAHGTESKYLEQVINETFRLYPAVKSFTNRVASESAQYKGQMIPKGAIVVYNAWLVHRDPDIWPDPMRFDPERFRPGKSHHPCAFAPFGFGERRCLGFELAMLVVKTLLCDIIIRYRVHLISPIELKQHSYMQVLTKPLEKIVVQLEPTIC